MGYTLIFLQLNIFYLFCLCLERAFGISSSAIWGKCTAGSASYVLLYRTFWRPPNPLSREGFLLPSLEKAKYLAPWFFPLSPPRIVLSSSHCFLQLCGFVPASLCYGFFYLFALCWQALFSRGKTWFLWASHLFLSPLVKMIILLAIAKWFIMWGIWELSLKNESQNPTQNPKIPAKLPYFLIEVEFINMFVTGYVGICLEPARSSNVVILGMDI